MCLALFFATWLVFSPGLGNGFVDYDDPDYVTQNSHIQAGLTPATIRWAFTTGDAGNWHPLTWLSHALDWQCFGDAPRGHHAVNLFWHALNTTLLFLVLARLTGAFWTGAACAALFAWHPLRVESVAWVAERKDVLCAFFGLLTLWLFTRFAETHRAGNPRSKIYYSLALAAFACGLMSKPMLVTLPFVLMLLDYWPLNRFSGRAIREKIPLLLLSAVACIVTYLVQKKSGAVVETLSLNGRLANAAVSVMDYLKSFFWPLDLAVGYPYPFRWPVAKVAAGTLIVLAIAGLAIVQWRRRPFVSIGLAWFLGMLMPVIGIVQVGQQARADRYTYLPMLGLEIALLWALREFIQTAPRRRLAVAVVALALLGCIARTRDQLEAWRNSRALYEHALAVTQDNYLAHACLGTTLLNENRPEDARAHFQQAIDLRPGYSVAYARLGLALEKLGRPQEALPHYGHALALRPEDAATRLRLADLLASLDRDEEALSHYRKAVELDAELPRAHRHYADSLRAAGRFAEACARYRIALAQQPRDAEAYYGLGSALEEIGKNEEALASYRSAVRLKPDLFDAQYNIGVMLLNSGRPVNAIPYFRSVLKNQPHQARAFIGLGLAAEALGSPREALIHYERALQLAPDFPGIAEKLSNMRRKAGANTLSDRAH